MNNVLLLKAGDSSVRDKVGDYDRWFIAAGSGRNDRFEIVSPHRGEALPRRPRDYDAILMTGSSSSATEPSPWMRRSGDFLREAAEQGVPVLGVCFGHQLLGAAYGGRVEKSPFGRELGTVEVELTEEGARDFLFAGLPRRLPVQATHEDHVPALPPGARLLARNGHSPVQAMAIGGHVRGVQFHPEMDAAAMRAVIEARAPGLGSRAHGLLEAVRPTPLGRQVLLNFLAHVT